MACPTSTKLNWKPTPDTDSDNDGLSDYEEIVLGTDPNRADSDYDGLSDAEEIRGWEFVYDFAAGGRQLKTWVTSDPLRIDGDDDGLTDFQEKTFGFHPRVRSELKFLTFSSTVRESKAPRLLLRLDETAGAAIFRDDSGYANNATCPSEGGCPEAGHYGRYVNAPQFNAAHGDYLEVAHNDLLNPERELTIAAWVRLDNPADNQKILGKTGLGAGYGLGVSGGKLCPAIWDSSGTHYTAQWGSLPAATWTHLAVTWKSGGSMVGYVNGQQVGSIAASANPIMANTDPLYVGVAAGGRIDEVVMFPRELAQAEIAELAAGRHNPEDLAVRPGDALNYEATVTNELLNRHAQGLLSANFPAAFSEPAPEDFVLNPQETITLTGQVNVGQAASGAYTLTQEADALISDWREASNYADMLLRLEEEAGATTFEDSSGEQPPREGECAAGQCPAAGEPGRYGYALHFDGANDVVKVEEANTNDPQVLTLATWVYPDTLPSRVMRFITLGGEKAVLRYDGSSYGGPGQLHFYVKIGGSLRHIRANNTLTAGEWQFVAGTYDGSVMRLYRNGVQVGSRTVSGQVSGKTAWPWVLPAPTRPLTGCWTKPRSIHARSPATRLPSSTVVPSCASRWTNRPARPSLKIAPGWATTGQCGHDGGQCPPPAWEGVSGKAVKFLGKDYNTRIRADAVVTISHQRRFFGGLSLSSRHSLPADPVRFQHGQRLYRNMVGFDAHKGGRAPILRSWGGCRFQRLSHWKRTAGTDAMLVAEENNTRAPSSTGKAGQILRDDRPAAKRRPLYPRSKLSLRRNL